MGKRTRVTAGASRGSCADCGYRAWLQDDGTVPDHEVRRVQVNPVTGKPQVFPGTEQGDEHCSGAGKAPEYLPPRVTRKREQGSMAA